MLTCKLLCVADFAIVKMAANLPNIIMKRRMAHGKLQGFPSPLAYCANTSVLFKDIEDVFTQQTFGEALMVSFKKKL